MPESGPLYYQITVNHFFSYFLLVSELYELNVFKLCNIFRTCLVPQALFMFKGF